MNRRRVRIVAAAALAAATWLLPGTLLTAQNQTPAQPQGGQAPGNQTPAQPAGTPLYVSPGIVRLVQQKLVDMGYPVPSISGAFGEHTAAALAAFQRKEGLSPGGDLDELTLVALGMPEVLTGGVPPGGDQPVDESAAATGGAPLSASPRLTRVIQHALTNAGFPTHNVFGIWITEIDNAPRNFQKAKGLDPTNTLDLALIHVLGLTNDLVQPKPGTLPTDSVVSILSEDNVMLTGTPITISSFGIRQVQRALSDRGHKNVRVDGKWSEETAEALKAFQQAQKLEPTGSLNLRTLKALGFDNPLVDLDRPPSAGKPSS